MAHIKKPNSSALLGAAAEHYVMCQLLRRQMIAALAPTGVPDADIIVSDRLGSALTAIQVKARRNIGSDGGWHMKAKHEEMTRPLLFYCFVDFGNDLLDLPRCWVIPSAIVAEALIASYQAWLHQPGKDGKKRNENDMRRLRPEYDNLGLKLYSRGWLDTYYEGWELISQTS